LILANPLFALLRGEKFDPDFTEGNEGNEGPGQKLRLFVSFVTFCKNSEF
jgi:hypothetical protein